MLLFQGLRSGEPAPGYLPSAPQGHSNSGQINSLKSCVGSYALFESDKICEPLQTNPTMTRHIFLFLLKNVKMLFLVPLTCRLKAA